MEEMFYKEKEKREIWAYKYYTQNLRAPSLHKKGLRK